MHRPWAAAITVRCALCPQPPPKRRDHLIAEAKAAGKVFRSTAVDKYPRTGRNRGKSPGEG